MRLKRYMGAGLALLLLSGCSFFDDNEPQYAPKSTQTVISKSGKTEREVSVEEKPAEEKKEPRRIVKYKYGSNLVGTFMSTLPLTVNDAMYKDVFIEQLSYDMGLHYAWIGIGSDTTQITLSSVDVKEVSLAAVEERLHGFAAERGVGVEKVPNDRNIEGESYHIAVGEEEWFVFTRGERVVIVYLKGSEQHRQQLWSDVKSSYESDF